MRKNMKTLGALACAGVLGLDKKQYGKKIFEIEK